MACTNACSITSTADPSTLDSFSTSFAHHACQPRRRRHSSYHPKTWAFEPEDIQVIVDDFLVDLGRRLEMLETYGHVKIDGGVKCAYSALRAVHDRCVQVSDDIWGVGRRRARVMVEVLESQYHGALARKDTLEQKVKEAVQIMESVCVELERKAYDVRQVGLAHTAHDMLDSGMAYAETASTRAAEMMSEGAEAARRAKEKLKLKVEIAIAQARKHRLITYDMLPDPWRCNPHIRSGYRFSETKIECLQSCFRLSNETVNIWSHAIGLGIVFALAFYFYPATPAFSQATNFDIFVTGCFFFAAAKCLTCSVMWHAMSSISNQTLMERFACVDYTGISLLVAASIMTTEWTAFYCEARSRWLYIAATMSFGTLGTILPWYPTFNRPDMAWARVGFYVSLAATGFLPVLQLTWQRGWPQTAYFYAPVSQSIAVYLVGAIIYAAKLPERWGPGWFDYVGGSHNIWHFAVLGGIFYHYVAMQSFFSDAFQRAEVGCS